MPASPRSSRTRPRRGSKAPTRDVGHDDLLSVSSRSIRRRAPPGSPQDREPLGSARVSTSPTRQDLCKRGQRGWPASFPLAQLPNAPLLAALAGWFVAALTGKFLHNCARATFYTALAAWAWKELEDGVNWARRGIGAAALLFVVAKLARALRT